MLARRLMDELRPRLEAAEIRRQEERRERLPQTGEPMPWSALAPLPALSRNGDSSLQPASPAVILMRVGQPAVCITGYRCFQGGFE